MAESELAGGTRTADGTLLASFRRRKGDGPDLVFIASWRKAPDGEPTVEFWFPDS